MVVFVAERKVDGESEVNDGMDMCELSMSNTLLGKITFCCGMEDYVKFGINTSKFTGARNVLWCFTL